MQKKLAGITLAAIALSISGLTAGDMMMAPVKQLNVPPVIPPPAYGVGGYFALHGGVNVYQSYEGTERRGDFALETREKVGGYGGIKLGYGWAGSGAVSPAVELDAFYNGADFSVDARENGDRLGSVTGRFDTGAVLVNGIARFGEGPFKPYVGAGIGGWFGQISDTRIAGTDGGGIRINDGGTNGGFAWQVMAGFDYFLNPSMSLFGEAKLLAYHDINLPSADDPMYQVLVGVGVRWFFN
jgi:opacity protein-like surface antigen